jgi:hypothetical protein
MIKAREDKVPNIRDSYNVTDKADGLRMMGFVDAEGELFMIDMSLNIYRTGLKRIACAKSLVDGEYVTRTKAGEPISQFLLFDIYYDVDGKDVSQFPFASQGAEDKEGRHSLLQKWTEKWNEGDGPKIIPGLGVRDGNKIMVASKTFILAQKGDTSIFEACSSILNSEAAKVYHTDGLILTPNELPLPSIPGAGFEQQFKWKPSMENTVDFLVVFDKDVDTKRDIVNTGVKEGTGETVQYKSMHLYVGKSK